MRIAFFALLCLTQAVSAAEWTTRPLSDIAVFPGFRAPATVFARDESRLSAEVSARIVAMPVREGEPARRGDELVRLDAAAYRIELDRARSQLALAGSRVRLAEAQLDQARALAGKGFISADGLRIRETELAVLRSEADAARAAVDAAQLAITRTVIRAPYDGVVRTRLANVGDLAVPGSGVLTFAASADAEIRARVPQEQIADLKAAGEWTLKAGGAIYRLQVRRISPVVERAGQAREVVLEAQDALPPGLAGELQWQSAALHLPSSYLLQLDDRLGVFVERDGKAEFVPVPGAQAGRAARVALAPDTRIIDEGRFELGLRGAR